MTDGVVISNFLSQIQSSYNKNPYHNSLHACDVANSVCFYLSSGYQSFFSPLESCSLIISAFAHDAGHPGVNNAFLVATKSVFSVICYLNLTR